MSRKGCICVCASAVDQARVSVVNLAGVQGDRVSKLNIFIKMVANGNSKFYIGFY